MTHIIEKTRTDAEILIQARDALEFRRTVPGGVHVRVDNAVVTLTGCVYSEFERSEAEDAVTRIEGVDR